MDEVSMRLLRLVLGILVLCLAGCSGNEAPGIGGTKARELMAKGAVLVDVRSSLEHRFWSPIEGSINIPFGDLEEKMKTLDKAKPIIVYSRTGKRSAQAKDVLSAGGFEAYNLGGLADWER